MPSITTSKEPLIEVDKLNLLFKTNIHRSWTFRDALVDFSRSGLPFKQGDRLHVLKDIDFKVLKGQRVGILGVNGVGKSSLCRCIAGFYRPSSGSVKVRGEIRPIFNAQMAIHPELTGRENLRLLARFMFPYSRKEQAAIVQEAGEFSELGNFLDAPFKIYSNGMQARLTLSLVTSRPAEIMILDEVFEGADLFFSQKVTERIKRVIAASGAVLFVSHSPAQVEAVCNRVIVLERGSIAFDGPVAQGIAFYASTLQRLPGAPLRT